MVYFSHVNLPKKFLYAGSDAAKDDQWVVWEKTLAEICDIKEFCVHGPLSRRGVHTLFSGAEFTGDPLGMCALANNLCLQVGFAPHPTSGACQVVALLEVLVVTCIHTG